MLMFSLVCLFVLGAIFGSFVNALVWRLYQQSLGKKRSSKLTDNDLSIVHGRSVCTHCGHQLSWLDLIPLVSWVFLAGKCRYCKKSIGLQYPAVELMLGILFILSRIYWPGSWDILGTINFAAWLVMLTGFVALAAYDLKWMLLPNRIVYPLLALAVVLSIMNVSVGSVTILEVALSVLIAGGIFYALFVISDGRWIGGGDVKLGILIGVLLASPKGAFLMLMLASLLGTMVALPGLLLKRLDKSSHIPFGPFLIGAAVVVYLFGSSMIAWYERVVLLQG